MNTIPLSVMRSSLLAAITLSMSLPLLADDDYPGYGNAVYDYAEVVQAEPIYRTVERRLPIENCWTEQVRHERQQPRDSGGSYLGPVLGAVIGGGIGNAVGHHKRNQQVGAAVGAVLGATVGHEITRDKTAGGGVDVYYTNERRCDTTYQVEAENRTVGYWVTYLYRGQEYRTRMDSHPGSRIRVRVTVEPA